MRALLALLACGLVACGASGSVTVTTWGEAYIEQRIPEDSPEEAGFVDGWTLRYQRFLVTLSEVTLARRTGEVGPTQDRPRVVDLVKPGPVEVFTWAEVPATKWERASYAIVPATSDAVGAGAVSAEDVGRMTSGGLSLFVEGTATKGATTKHFAWPLALDTHYEDCSNPDFGEGLTVPLGSEAVMELTIHGDHPWYDDLQSPTAVLRFEAIAAADADADGEVTLAELDAVPLTHLPLDQYGTGSAPRVKSLGDFVRALFRTVGHFRGEGDCHARAR